MELRPNNTVELEIFCSENISAISNMGKMISNNEGLDSVIEKCKINSEIKGKIIIENSIFNKYCYVHSDNTETIYAKRSIMGFNIYLCDSNTLIGRLKSNIFGTKYSFEFINESNSKFEVFYESYFFERGRPRSFEIKLNSLELLNKKPFFNNQTNTFNLNFNGRVTMPSVRNFQVIHPLEPAYITLTFGKVSENTYILDFSHPWSILFAFCLGLTSLDHKFGCN